MNQKSYSTDKLRGSETILLVEDSEPLRKLVKTFLESAGYRVFSADSGESALEVSTSFGHPWICCSPTLLCPA